MTAERCRRSLSEFCRQAWHVLEPERLVWTWVQEAMCLHLEAVWPHRKITELLINVAPGSTKSSIVSVFWPAWAWLHTPWWRVLSGSYNDRLAEHHTMKMRDVVRSQWYRETFEPDWDLKHDQDLKSQFSNTVGGLRMAVSIKGGGTGFHGHAIVFDDPHNVKDRPSEDELEAARFWWFGRMRTRRIDRENGPCVGVMQRVHDGDLSSHCLAAGYEHLCIPTEFDPERRCRTSIGWEDSRTDEGELAMPERISQKVVEAEKVALGPDGYAAQHQQDPLPKGGGIVREEWCRYWYDPELGVPEPVVVRREDGEWMECPQKPLPTTWDFMLTSWDLSFKSTATSCPVSGTRWGMESIDDYLLAELHGKYGFAELMPPFATFCKEVPCDAHLVEDKANGPAMISVMRSHVSGLVEVDPAKLGGDKIRRGHAASPKWSSGHMWLPHPAQFPWVIPWRNEITRFPFAKRNDRFDTMSQAVVWYQRRDMPKRLYMGGVTDDEDEE